MRRKDFLPVAMFLALDYVWDKCKENRNVNKCVFIDETWRLVCSDAPIEAANFVVEIFRTIRGFGGSAVAATQNIADFFSAGIGTAIIGNAKIKMILRSEKGSKRDCGCDWSDRRGTQACKNHGPWNLSPDRK